MAFTKVVGPGIHTLAQLRTHNIHSAGIITATKFVGEMESGGGDSTFQNVTVQGNLTVQGDQTTLNTTLRNVELLRVSTASTLPAGIITQTGTGDILSLRDNTNEVFKVADGGNVAINKTAGISAKLHIGDSSNNGALSQLIKLGNDSSGAGTGAQINMGVAHGNESTAACVGGFYDGTGTSFIVKTAGTYANQSTVGERLRITSGGNVNIGTGETTQTARMLNVYGGAARVTQTSGGNTIEAFGGTTSGQSYGLLVNAGTTANDYAATFRNSGGTTMFRVRGDGKVGIGTDNPTQGKLVAQTASGMSIAAVKDNTGASISLGGVTQPRILFESDPSASTFKLYTATGSSYGSAGWEERFRINSSGDVKVISRGSSTSGAPFYVAVTGKSSNSYTGGNDDTACLRIVDNGTTNSYYHGIELRAKRGGDARIYVQDMGSDVSDLTFATDNSAVTEKMRITSAGNVGINTSVVTTAQDRALTVYGTTGGELQLKAANYGGGASGKGAALTWSYGSLFLTNHSDNGDIHFQTKKSGESTSEKMRITESGRIGINTTAPGSLVEIYNSSTSGNTVLHVHNDKTGDAAVIRLEGGRTSSNDFAKVLFSNSGNNNALIQAIGSADQGSLTFMTSDTGSGDGMSTYLQIAANGNIKLGKNSQNAPGARLHLEDVNTTAYNANATTSAASVYLVNTGTNGPMGVILQNASTDGSNTCQATISSIAEGTNKNTTLTFGTRQNSDATIRERVRITSGGRVGIGKSSDITCALHVYHATNNEQARFESGDAYSHIVIKDSGSHATAPPYFGVQSNDFRWITHDGTNSAERLRLKSDGKVGIGDDNPPLLLNLKDDSNSTFPMIGLEGSWTSSGGVNDINSNPSGGYGEIRLGYIDGTNRAIRGSYNHGLGFMTNNGEAFRIANNGNCGVVRYGVDDFNTPFYVAVNAKSSITYSGGSADTACIRIKDEGTTNGYYHGLEMRTKQGGDVRLYAHDQGNDLADLVIATDNSALLERARFTQYGLQLTPYTTDSANSGYPISTFTDGGTRFSTHLATHSGYSGNGEIICITSMADHTGGYEMFAVRITGYWYSNTVGGAIDCVVGCYSGENAYYNPTVTGTYPVNWRDNIKFASITSGNNQGKMCIRLGAVGSANNCEIAFTDCTHGFSGQSAAKTSGWRVIKVNDQSVINSTYNGTTTTAVHRSNEFYNDEFAVGGAGTGELLTNRRDRGGTIQGTYQYTQMNQGTNYYHYIKSPKGDNDITDDYATTNWSAIVTVGMTGTGTKDTATTWFFQDSSDETNQLVGNNLYGNTSYTSNRVVMGIDNGRPFWRTAHSGSYRVSVKVQFLHGGLDGATYTDEYGDYGGN